MRSTYDQNRAMTPHPTLGNWLTIIGLSIVWGGTFMVTALALDGYGPLTVACARTTLAAVSLLIFLRISGRQLPRDPQQWAFVVPVGICSTALPFFLLSWGQQWVTTSFAGLSMAAVPLFVLPLAHFFSDEQLTPRKALGFGLGFVGVALVLAPKALDGRADLLPHLACFVAALSYAVASILTRRCPPIDPIALAAGGLMVGAAALIPAMLLVEGLPHWAGATSGTAIVFLGLVPTALAVVLRVIIVRKVGSGFMTLTSYQVPLWSMGFGALLLGEALPGTFFAALALIITGMALSQTRRTLPLGEP